MTPTWHSFGAHNFSSLTFCFPPQHIISNNTPFVCRSSPMLYRTSLFVLSPCREHISSQLLLLNFADLPQTRSAIRFKRSRLQRQSHRRLRSEIKVRVSTVASDHASSMPWLTPLANASSLSNTANTTSRVRNGRSSQEARAGREAVQRLIQWLLL